jgi:hypothetical protein
MNWYERMVNVTRPVIFPMLNFLNRQLTKTAVANTATAGRSVHYGLSIYAIRIIVGAALNA